MRVGASWWIGRLCDVVVVFNVFVVHVLGLAIGLPYSSLSSYGVLHFGLSFGIARFVVDIFPFCSYFVIFRTV